jgi:hypothetical protein
MSRRCDLDRPASQTRQTGTTGFTWIARASAITLVSSLAVAGCGRPEIVPVSGRITFEGQPVTQAIVRFQPEARPMAGASTDADGRYRLTTRRPGDGAYLGRHRVGVTPLIPGEMSVTEAAVARTRVDIPKIFRDATSSPLTVEVTAQGPNEFDFELAKDDGAGQKR